jgi:hypothetical protein
MTAGRSYRLICGNYECPTRLEPDPVDKVPPRLFVVPAEELPDGEIWYCSPKCRAEAER